MQFVAVAALLIQFSTLGSFVVGLRVKVREKNGQLEGRNRELETALARIEELAIRDELTGAYNRRHLMEIIQREKWRSERAGVDFSIFIIDVDFFKNVNDSYGHLAGDCVLRAIAKTASDALRQTDYFGRYGGEEFAAVVTDTSVEGAMVTAERVRQRIEALRFPDIADELRLTASIGIAAAGAREETTAIFKRADDALYVAKRSGRNRCIMAEPLAV
jgi:diguanylate cyclase (GGDEF)-like protein